MSAFDEEYDSPDSPVREEDNQLIEEDKAAQKEAYDNESSDESDSGESEGGPEHPFQTHSPASSPVDEGGNEEPETDNRQSVTEEGDDEPNMESENLEVKRETKVSDPFEDDSDGGESGDEMASAVASATAQVSRFIRESDSEEEEEHGSLKHSAEVEAQESEDREKEWVEGDSKELEQERLVMLR